MLRYLTSGFLLMLLLLMSCNNSWFAKEKPKPYYFSKVKNQPAYHSLIKREKAQIPVADSTAYQTKPDEFQPSNPAKSSTFAPIPALVSGQVQPVHSHEKSLAENKSSKGQKQVHQQVKSTKKQNNNWLFLSAVATFTILSSSVFSLLLPRTKGLASWAKQNKNQARWLIGLGQILTGFTAYFIGRQLAGFGISTTEASTYPLLCLAAFSALAYPDKNKSRWLKYSFRRNKVVSLLLVLSGFFLFMNLGNREVTDKNFNPTAKQISEAAGSSFYADWQEEFKVDTESSADNPTSVLLDILLVILALALSSLVFIITVAMFCSLSCSGQPVLAYIVLVGGTALALLPIVLVAIKIIRKSDQPKVETDLPDDKKKPPKEELKWF